MTAQDHTEQELAEQRRAERLENLAEPGHDYSFGCLDGLVSMFLEGGITKRYLQQQYLQLHADMKTAREGGAQ